MVSVKLVSQRLTDGVISVHPAPPKPIDIKTSYSLNIDYTEDNTLASATLEQCAFCPSDERMFNIKITARGSFKCEGILTDGDKREAHVLIYAQLFPYVQSFISQTSVWAGLPPLLIPADRIDREKVNIR